MAKHCIYARVTRESPYEFDCEKLKFVKALTARDINRQCKVCMYRKTPEDAVASR